MFVFVWLVCLVIIVINIPFDITMFIWFILLVIPKETRTNALVFVVGFSAYQFIFLADSLLIYLITPIVEYDTTFHYALSATIIYGIINKLSIENNYISLMVKLLIAMMVVNLVGWLMYDSYISPVYYDIVSNTLLLLIICIFTWSLPGGRNFIKNRYSAMVYSFNTKGDPIQTEQRKEKGL